MELLQCCVQWRTLVLAVLKFRFLAFEIYVCYWKFQVSWEPFIEIPIHPFLQIPFPAVMVHLKRNFLQRVAGHMKYCIGCGLDDRGSIPGRGWDIFLRHRVRTGSRDHPTSYRMGNGSFSPGVRRPGREFDHTPPSSADLKNVWSCSFIPSIRLHGAALN
jgi:hypothetical protein